MSKEISELSRRTLKLREAYKEKFLRDYFESIRGTNVLARAALKRPLLYNWLKHAPVPRSAYADHINDMTENALAYKNGQYGLTAVFPGGCKAKKPAKTMEEFIDICALLASAGYPEIATKTAVELFKSDKKSDKNNYRKQANMLLTIAIKAGDGQACVEKVRWFSIFGEDNQIINRDDCDNQKRKLRIKGAAYNNFYSTIEIADEYHSAYKAMLERRAIKQSYVTLGLSEEANTDKVIEDTAEKATCALALALWHTAAVASAKQSVHRYQAKENVRELMKDPCAQDICKKYPRIANRVKCALG